MGRKEISFTGSDACHFLPSDEFGNVVRDSGAAYIIASSQSLDNCLLIQQQMTGQVKRVFLLDTEHLLPHPVADNRAPGAGVRYDSLLSLMQESTDEDPDLTVDVSLRAFEDIFTINFSSGTTGKPKAVAKTHSALLSVSYLRTRGLDFVPIGESGHVVSCHPHFAHVGGMCMLILALTSDAVACIMDSFTVPKFLAAVNEHRITSVFAVPSQVTQVLRFVQHPDNRSVVSHLNLSSLTDLLIAGEFLPKDVSQQFLRTFPHVTRFRQSFGSTEMGFATIVPSDMANESNVLSSGIPVPGFSVRIIPTPDQGSGTERFLPPNQVGEICVKGPQLTIGYLKNPAANSEAFDEDGFFRTGDGGYMDEKGLLYVTDRFKEIIKCDGMQVSPAELESILLSHPAVREAAVIGIPHQIHGHVPRAFVVLKTPASSSSQSPAGTTGCDTGVGRQTSLGKGTVTTTTTGSEAVVVVAGATNETEDASSDNPDIVNELTDFVSNHVSSHKQIRGGIRILPTFQRTVIGKIDRKFLRTHFSLPRES